MSIAFAPVAAGGAFGPNPANSPAAPHNPATAKSAYVDCHDAALQAAQKPAQKPGQKPATEPHGARPSRPSKQAGGQAGSAADSKPDETEPAAATETQPDTPAENPASGIQPSAADASAAPIDPANAGGGVVAWLLDALRPAMKSPPQEGDAPPANAARQGTVAGAAKALPQLSSEADETDLVAPADTGMSASNLAPAAHKAESGFACTESVEGAASPAIQQAASAPQVNPALAVAAASGSGKAVTQLQLPSQDLTAAALPPLQLDDPGWPTTMTGHLQLQLEQGVQEARLELHPRDWGTVQIQLRIVGNEAQVQFSASHPQAHEALAAGLPELRALLAGDGLVAQTQVGRHIDLRGYPTRGLARRNGLPEDDDTGSASTALRIVRVGLVDNFA